MRNKLFSALAGLALLVGTSSCAVSAAEQHKMDLQKKMLSSYEQCFDGKYDGDIRCLEDNIEEVLKEASKGIYPLGVFVHACEENEYQIIGVGTGVLFEGGYVLTAYHVGHKETGDGWHTNIYLGASDKAFLLETIAEDKELDFSLMKIVDDIPNIETYELGMGSSSDLRVGNVIYFPGNAHGRGLNTREGILSQPYFRYDNTEPPRMGISNGGNEGDSGAPVFALRDGKIELVGMIIEVAVNSNNLSYIVPIDDILIKLKELMPEEEIPIKNKTITGK